MMSGAMDARLESLVVRLFEVEAVKFGDFKLKSGIMSPVYFDLRVIVSFPSLLAEVAELLWGLADAAELDVVCGVPYTALPIATVMSVRHELPMVIRRKESKDYGTQRMVEGRFAAGARCLVVEDVVTSGSSVLETAAVLRTDGLVVRDAVVLLDREQGGRAALEAQGVRMHSVLTLRQLLQCLERRNLVKPDMVQRVEDFLNAHSNVPAPAAAPKAPAASPAVPALMSMSRRRAACTNEVARRLYSLMEEKKTNLCVAADVTTSSALLRLAEDVGPHICILKTHADLVNDFTPEVGEKLKHCAAKHNFMIFEDRKFADIGRTVSLQASAGPARILEWADLINAHCLPGPGVLQGLREAVKECKRPVGCLLVAQMSSAGALITPNYTAACVAMATEYSDLVVGFICQERLSGAAEWMLHCTPGVKLEGGGDSLGQQYSTPYSAVLQRGVDVLIVGRGVSEAADAASAALSYRQEGYASLAAREETAS